MNNKEVDPVDRGEYCLLQIITVRIAYRGSVHTFRESLSVSPIQDLRAPEIFKRALELAKSVVKKCSGNSHTTGIK